MSEFDTGNTQADVNINLAARETGTRSASEILFNATQGDRTAMAGGDKTSFEDGGFRGITQDHVSVQSEIETSKLAATLIAMSQDKVQTRLASIGTV